MALRHVGNEAGLGLRRGLAERERRERQEKEAAQPGAQAGGLDPDHSICTV